MDHAVKTDQAPDTDEDVSQLLDLLAVEAVGGDLYRAASPVLRGRRNIFGGQVMAQALRAAAATVDPDRHPHSLHAYFLREGQFEQDVDLTVERVRDGGSFSMRQVTARQADRTIFTLSASFQRDEPGRDFATGPLVTSTAPDTNWSDPIRHRPSSFGIDLVEADETLSPRHHHTWARTRGTMPDDRVLNACVLAYMSDLGPGRVAASAVGLQSLSQYEGPIMASLDHAMWFHRPVRCSDWLLVDAVPLSTQTSRGLIRGSIHTADGLHVATFNQEVLVRERH